MQVVSAPMMKSVSTPVLTMETVQEARHVM